MSQETIPEWFSEATWAGKVRSLPFRNLKESEVSVFERDFAKMVDALRKHDPEIAANFNAKKEYYKLVAGVFSQIFDLPFGGVETSSGEFGMTGPLLPSYPFLAARNWVQTISAGWNNLYGSSSSGIAGNSTVGTRRMYAYQSLLSVNGNPKLMAYKPTINGYSYPGINTLSQIKIPKKETFALEIPLLKCILIHPTGTHYVRAAFEQAGQVELVPMGLMFAEHDYLNTEGYWYT